MARKLLENQTCGRCAGSGRYGPSGVYAGLCFNCHGDGVVLTKRGKAAQAYLNKLRMRPLVEFKVGEEFLVEGFCAGSFSVPSCWYKVTEPVKPDPLNAGQFILEGINAKGETMAHHGFSGDTPTMLRKRFTKNERAVQQQMALDYQATLTKTGTVAKRKFAQVAQEVSA